MEKINSLLRRVVILAASAAPLLFGAEAAHAVVYSFDNITNNTAGDAAIGEAQLSLDVTQSGSNVLFNFINAGPLASVIAQVYFDETADLLAGYVSESNMGTVNFGSDRSSPPNLPGGNSISPNFTATLAFDAQNPAPTNGVGPNEKLGLSLSLTGGSTFNQVIAALNDGSLRVGVHVQAFQSGGSESFINSPATVIPLPATLPLLMGGLAGLGFIGWRRKAA